MSVHRFARDPLGACYGCDDEAGRWPRWARVVALLMPWLIAALVWRCVGGR